MLVSMGSHRFVFSLNLSRAGREESKSEQSVPLTNENIVSMDIQGSWLFVIAKHIEYVTVS